MENQPIAFLDPVGLLCSVGAMLCWTVAYIVIIRRGIVDKTYGMPLIPLCVNVSWEFIFSMVYPDKPPLVYVNAVWLVFDVGIVYTYLRYGRSEYPTMLPRWTFVPSFLLILAFAFCGVLAVTYQFGDWTGSYTGWGGALMIEAALIAMLLRRGSTRGQSMYIAVLTLAGDAFVIAPELRITGPSPLMIYLYVSIVLLGLVYVALLYRAFKSEGKSLWQY